jgi:hypothetical protein
MLDEGGWTLPPADASPEEANAIMQKNQASQDVINKTAVWPTPAGPVVGASTNPAVQQAVKDASGGQFVAKSAPAATPAPDPAATPTNAPVVNTLKNNVTASGATTRGLGNPAPATTPVNECNYTMENEYCPVHGLEECHGSSMFESELARIKQLMK